MSDEIKVNSENTPPRKNLATLGQVKDALDKRDEKINSLKEDIGYVTETIYGDNFLKTLETVKTELYYAKHTWFIPLNLYSQGDTMLFYFPTLSDGSYQTYLCDESKTAVQDINVVVKEHYSTVVYPKFGKQYAYLRMYAKKSSDVCYIKKMKIGRAHV